MYVINSFFFQVISIGDDDDNDGVKKSPEVQAPVVAPPFVAAKNANGHPRLDADKMKKVNDFMYDTNISRMVTNKYRVTVFVSDIKRLLWRAPSGYDDWLSDNLITCYFNMLMERSTLSTSSSMAKIHCIDTFFMSAILKLVKEEPESFIKRVNIFDYDMVFIPYNASGNHWTLISINWLEKSMIAYDSLQWKHEGELNRLFDFFSGENLLQKGSTLNKKDWYIGEAKTAIPLQQHCSDCGNIISNL